MTNPSVFLDTSFLVSTQVRVHPFHSVSLKLLEAFKKVPGLVLVAHPLVFDEFWYVLSGIWRRGCMPSGVSVGEGLITSTNDVFNFQNFKLLRTSLVKKDLLENIDLMPKFKLRPRDALIVTIMKKESISKIVSFDKDFDSIKGITRIFE